MRRMPMPMHVGEDYPGDNMGSIMQSPHMFAFVTVLAGQEKQRGACAEHLERTCLKHTQQYAMPSLQCVPAVPSQ